MKYNDVDSGIRVKVPDGRIGKVYSWDACISLPGFGPATKKRDAMAIVKFEDGQQQRCEIRNLERAD